MYKRGGLFINYKFIIYPSLSLCTISTPSNQSNPPLSNIFVVVLFALKSSRSHYIINVKRSKKNYSV